jgi:hypothetical protein
VDAATTKQTYFVVNLIENLNFFVILNNRKSYFKNIFVGFLLDYLVYYAKAKLSL